jgi:hypothetical protein
MKKVLVSVACLGLAFGLYACSPLVKTDLKSLNENPGQYKGKRVVVTTDLRNILETPEDYFGKKVEVTGYVTTNRLRRSGDWSFILEDEEGRSVTCYEWKYRIDSWLMPSMAIKRAARENGQVTVVGKLEKDLEIELDWIEYEDQHYDTDYLPYTAYRGHPYYHGYCLSGIGGSWHCR